MAAVHVYFPDPWWKTRHKKRLLFTPEFAATSWRRAAARRRLHFVTDVADYFAMVIGAAGRRAARSPSCPPPAEHRPEHDMDYLTNFERKFRKEGRPIYRAAFSRTDTPGVLPCEPSPASPPSS